MKTLFTPKPASQTEQEALNWLHLIRTENVGPVTFRHLLEQFGTTEEALKALPDLAKKGGRKKPLKAPGMATIEREYKQIRKLKGDILTLNDPRYPALLQHIPDAPPVITVIGNTDLLQRQSLAIVGARNASQNGLRFAQTIAQQMGAQDYAITSGLARGIDTAAHNGALETGTIAVLAGGADIVYPQENTKLYEQIKDKGGLIIAESPLGVQPRNTHFPRRNRIVSGLSVGILVVEATLKSGSLITARLAGEHGRDVFAVPGHPHDPRASGPNALIRDGATLVQRAEDILEALHILPGLSDSAEPTNEDAFKAPPSRPLDVSDADRPGVIDLLSRSGPPVHDLVRQSGLNIAQLQTILLELELAGHLQRLPGNQVCLIGAIDDI